MENITDGKHWEYPIFREWIKLKRELEEKNKVSNYEIIPTKDPFKFIVKNLKNGKEYNVDTLKPFCTCLDFKWNKEKKKKLCKHLKMVKGLKNIKI